MQFLQSFLDKRLFSIFVFGIASGFPWVMIGSVMTAWLKDEGLSRTDISLFGSIFAVYAINFLWSPLLDRLKVPLLGQRRGWILAMQLCIIGSCLLMSTLHATSSLFHVALFGLVIALCSATQDIAIDAYRIDIIENNEREKLAAGSSMATAGWWTGYGGLGALPFFIADWTGWAWNDIYLLLAAIMSGITLFTFVAKEPIVDRTAQLSQATAYYEKVLGAKGASPTGMQKIGAWLFVTIAEPFREFFQRNGVRLALSLLLFIFLFKIGEAFLGRMSLQFYIELGFSKSEIGGYSKLLNWWATIVFSILGGIMTMRYGIYRGLMIAGIAMASSNLMFALMAHVGPDKTLFALTIIVDGFTAAWGTVAMVAFISVMCNRTFSASQYALMASLSVAGKNLLASGSGYLVDKLNGDWSTFFIITALMVIPSLLFLRGIKKYIIRAEQQAG